MADAKVDLDLDPKKILESLGDMGEEVKKLSLKIEESLGKDAAKSIGKLEDAAERGTSKIQSSFRNMGQRVKEDLKTAFDATGILAGAKFAKELGEGVKQVFDMERAFDRLNTRLQLSSRALQDFKKQMGARVSATGAKLEDVMPGTETAASRGGVKDPGQLASIAESLGQARMTTGEDTKGISEAVVEILKSQGQKVTGSSFKSTLDAMQATRANGAFGTAGEAGAAIAGISPYGQQMGLNTREMGGLAATASKSGAAGQDILRQLMEQASHPGGKEKLNAIFGQNVFDKGGKLDASALGKINTKKFGEFSQQTMESATGISGASGADLTRFVEAFKGGMGEFKNVVSGANETSSQFEAATDNLASGIDRFREKTKEAAREVGSSLSKLGHDILAGNGSQILGDVAEVGKTAHANKGQLAAAGLLTAGVGVLAGGALRRMGGKMGGLGGMLGGQLGGQMAKMAGVTPVYVTNAKEMASGSTMVEDFMKQTGALAGGGGGALGKFGKVAGMAGKGLAAIGGAAAAAEIGMAIGDAIMQVPAVQKMTGGATDWAYDAINGKSDKQDMDDASERARRSYLQSPAHKASVAAGTAMTPEAIAAAVAKGTHEGQMRANAAKRPTFTNKSSVKGTGGSM